MAVNLVKGQKIDLTKGNAGLKQIMVGLGWEPATSTGKGFLAAMFGGGAKKDFDCEDVEQIRKAMEELSKENEGIVTKLYQAAAEKAQAEQSNNKQDDEIIVEDK